MTTHNQDSYGTGTRTVGAFGVPIPMFHESDSLFSTLPCFASLSSSVMKSLMSLMAMLATSSKTTTKREFRLVPYGAPASAARQSISDENRRTISCDGRVEGVDLELTHWAGNKTPQHLYADTSTEIALKLAKLAPPMMEEYRPYHDALILNNHYDTDGVLSCWTCLEPEVARKYESLLVEGAAAGDFGEWTSQAGMILNFCLENSAAEFKTDDVMYEKAYELLPALLDDIECNHGSNYEHWWIEDWKAAEKSYKDYRNGAIRLTRGPGKVVIVEEGNSGTLNCYALHRALVEENLWNDTTRILFASGIGDQKSYRYELVGHGWVQRLIDRPHIPAVKDAEKLVQQMNKLHGSDVWTSKAGSLIGVCRTIEDIDEKPQHVADLLHSLDEGAIKARYFAETSAR